MFNDKIAEYQRNTPGQVPVSPEDLMEARPEMSFSAEEPGVDEELWPGGPMLSQVMSWKAQFGDGHVLMSEIADEVFVWRTLNRFEYKAIVSTPNVDPLQREEMIAETCVLWHPGGDEAYTYHLQAQGMAGVPARLAELIMERSGFDRNVSTRAL